jgi:hypothetical protein
MLAHALSPIVAAVFPQWREDGGRNRSAEVERHEGRCTATPLRRQADMRSVMVARQSRGRCHLPASAEGAQPEPPITREADGLRRDGRA